MPSIFDWINLFVNQIPESRQKRQLAQQQIDINERALEREKMLDRPIFERPPTIAQSDLQAPTGLRGGDVTEEGYKSPITYRALEAFLPALQANVIPETERTGLGFLPWEAGQKPTRYQPDLFVDKSGKPFWITPGQPIPEGATKWQKDTATINPYQLIKLVNDPYAGIMARQDPRIMAAYDEALRQVEGGLTPTPEEKTNRDVEKTAKEYGWVGPRKYEIPPDSGKVYDIKTAEEFIKIISGSPDK